MILTVHAAGLEGREISVAEVCAGARLSTVSALRWIDVMIKGDFIQRLDASVDMRRATLGMTDKGAEAMNALLDRSAG